MHGYSNNICAEDVTKENFAEASIKEIVSCAQINASKGYCHLAHKSVWTI
jgi:hypothetical protein